MKKLILVFLLGLQLSACTQSSYFSPLAFPTSGPQVTPTPTFTSSVCNPFSGGANPQIWGAMTYLPSTSINTNSSSPSYGFITDGTSINSFSDLIVHGSVYPTNFYFSQLNVPDQAFSQGFTITLPDSTTTQLTYPSMTVSIVSYFGLSFFSDLQLPAGSADQGYQFAAQADDGANLYLSNTEIPGPAASPNPELIINNDGVHAVSTVCSSAPYTLSANSKTHMHVDWFQGPPYYLGIVLYYRPWTDNQCDLSNSAWKVVPASWYNLPATAPLPNC